jgi:nitrite reductase/ring-hydroxylating ferredoxin subunit
VERRRCRLSASELTGTPPPHESEPSGRAAALGFNELLLVGVIVLMVAGALLTVALYGRPTDRTGSPQVEPAVRVAREQNYPVGASRLVRLGAAPILVVRLADTRYIAVHGASPSDGCLLRWEAEASRIVSPCSYLVYDVDGSVIAGLSTTPLARYPVFVRDGVVYVARGLT